MLKDIKLNIKQYQVRNIGRYCLKAVTTSLTCTRIDAHTYTHTYIPIMKGCIVSSGARGGFRNVSEGPEKQVLRSESIRKALQPMLLLPPIAMYS